VPPPPATPRTIAFFDGQNLFRSAREAFATTPRGAVDYSYPNYDPMALAEALCGQEGWQLQQVRFYTGVPPAPDWRHGWWSRKLAALGKHPRAYVWSRETRFGREKGIDVRLSLDVVGLALDGAFDVALIFSQDQDIAEVRDDIVRIARRQKRWIRLASAFPSSPQTPNPRGLNRTQWIPIDQALYEACLDPHDYRAVIR
jgi:uncharacterized LabA/DUF88 family protein